MTPMMESNQANTKPFSDASPGSPARDPIDILLKHMRPGYRGVIGSPLNLCRVLCEITEGMIGRTGRQNGLLYGWYAEGGKKKDIIQFRATSAFEIFREMNGEIALHSIEQQEYQLLRRRLAVLPVPVLINKLGIEKEYKTALDIYRKDQLNLRQRREAEKKRLERENSIESVLKRIESARSGDILFPLRGMKTISALMDRGFEPGICDNPDLWVDAEEFASLYCKNKATGEELLLIGREKLQAVTEQDRIEYKFVVAKSKDKPDDFRVRYSRFNRTREGDSQRNWREEFFQGLAVLTTYPEELMNRTVADLEVMAKAIDGVIDERSRIEEGLLPYDSLFKKQTRAILVDMLTAKKPLPEIRKNLDYFEHTGIIEPAYRDSLYELIRLEQAGVTLYDHLASGDRDKTLELVQTMGKQQSVDIRKILEGIEIRGVSENQAFKDYIYSHGSIRSSEVHKKRVKEIVTLILKNIPGEINAENIMIAMRPFVEELGLEELDRIRQRILELKKVVAMRQEQQQDSGGTPVPEEQRR